MLVMPVFPHKEVEMEINDVHSGADSGGLLPLQNYAEPRPSPDINALSP